MAVSERFQGANVVDAGRLSPYWGEHAARYVYALPFTEGNRVLDIACGTGYGVGLLSTKARFVTGVDIDADAVETAIGECGDNSSVLLGSALALPFGDASFDVVTSFETLEHLHHRGEFLTELGRVLVPHGRLILSTPNANYSQPVDGKPSNPFHIHEYDPDELRGELGQHFAISDFVGQTLDENAGIPPFFDAQQRLSKDPVTQLRLFGWKVLNKIPFDLREKLSGAIWGKPFYPTEMDYNFDQASIEERPDARRDMQEGLMQRGLVSVVIPNYNYAQYLRETIDSVLAQTYSGVEVIVVDDGSTDASASIIEEYGERIQTIFQKNQGVSAARNNGVKASHGEYIAFLDADDSWFPAKIEKQVGLFERSGELGLVHVGVVEIDADGKPQRERLDGLKGKISSDLLMMRRQSILGGGSGFLVTRKVFDEIGGFDERLSTSADWDLVYQIGSLYDVGFVAETLLRYRVHNSNMHSNIAVMEHDMMLAFEKAFSPMTPELARLRRRAYGSLHQNLAGSYFVAGEYKRFLAHSVKSLVFNPRNIVHYLRLPRTKKT